MSDEWPPRVSDQYVNLALVKHDKFVRRNEMNEFAKSTLHGTVDDLYFEKEAITFDNVFKPENILQAESLHVRRQLLQKSLDCQFESFVKGKPSGTDQIQQVEKLLKNLDTQSDIDRYILSQPLTQKLETLSQSNDKGLKILLDGAPGVGKTTMCHKACREWAQGKAFTDFKLLVYVPLRDEQVATATKLEDLLLIGSLHSREQIADELSNTDGEGILFLFDGWDELSPQQRGKASLLCRVILGKVLPLCSVLITSRPYTSQWLQKPDVTNRHVEIMGLTAHQVEECIRKELPNAAEALLEKLVVRSDLKTLSYVPMNLAMILYIYRTDLELPETLTGVYNLFIINALLRYLQDYDPSTEPIVELNSRNELPPPVMEMYLALCTLAFNGLLNDQVVFSKQELQNCHPNLPTSSNTLGIITATKGFVGTGMKMQYQFLHLTIQEFLAADALSRQPAHVQANFVIDHLQHARFRTMFSFLFGLCHLEHIKDVLRFLFATSINGSNVKRFLLLCHMLYEVNDTKAYRALTDDVESLPLPYDFTLFDVMVIGRFLSCSSMTIHRLRFSENLTRQKLALLITSISNTDPLKVKIERLQLAVGGNCSISDLAPFITHPVFNSTSFLGIDLPASPPLASKFLSCITSMPSLDSLHLMLRSPFDADKKAITSAPEDLVSTLEVVFTSLSLNQRITSLSLNLISDGDQFNETCGKALTQMLSSRAEPMSLTFHDPLYSKSFVNALSNSIATSSNVKAIKLYESSHSTKTKRCEAYLTATGAHILFTAMKTNVSVELLELNCIKPLFTDPVVGTTLQDFLSSNNTLKSFKMENCGITTAAATALASSLSKNKSLTELKLANEKVEIEAIMLSLASNSSSALQKLVLTNCQLEDKDEYCISLLLECSTSLRTLDLHANQLGSATAIGLFAALHDNSTLEELILSHNQLGVGNTEALSSTIEGALRNNHTLKQLQLNETCLPNEVILAIANALAGESGLKVIGLKRNGISLNTVKKFCLALQANSCLKELYMSEDIPFDSDTIDQLNEMVIANTTLTALSMQFGKPETITNNAAMQTVIQSLVKALHRNTTLTKVVLNGLGSELLDSVNFSRICQNKPVIRLR